jgi:hypothetical protein
MKQNNKDVDKPLRKGEGKVNSINLIKSIKHYKRCWHWRANFWSIWRIFSDEFVINVNCDVENVPIGDIAALIPF